MIDVITRYVKLRRMSAAQKGTHPKHVLESMRKEIDELWAKIPDHQILEASRRSSVEIFGGPQAYSDFFRDNRNWFTRYPYMRKYVEVMA